MGDDTFKYTIISANGKIVTKKISDDGQGGIIKDGSACWISEGTGQVINCTLKEFAGQLQGFNMSQAIIHGVPKKADLPDDFRIVSSVRQRRGKHKEDTITRTKDDFDYPPDSNLLFMVDNDQPKKYTGDQAFFTTENILKVIAEVLPGYEQAGKVVTCSTSSCIYDADGVQRTGEGAGRHIYSITPPGTDMKRFKEIFKIRAWLAGYGDIKISKAGSLLERNLLFDEFVLSPERLDFVAGAKMPEGWEQTRQAPLYIDGGVFDPALLPDVTTLDREKYKTLVSEAKAALKAEADQVKAGWITAKGQELFDRRKKINPDDTVTIEECASIAKAACDDGNLYGDFLLYFDHLDDPVTVADVLAAPEKFDKYPLKDPLEGEEGIRGKAMFFNKGKVKNKPPMIHSFVHGDHKYNLLAQTNDEQSNIIDKAIDSHQAGEYGSMYAEPVLDVLNDIKKKDKAAYMHYRSLLKNLKNLEITKLETALEGRDNQVKFGKHGSEKYVLNFYNSKHAGVMIGGQFRIINEITNHVFNTPDISLSPVKDFHDRYCNHLMPAPGAPEKILKASHFWLEHTMRRNYDGIVFEPGKKYENKYNLWKGFSVNPKKGDWSLMQWHLENIICNGNKDRARWVFAWYANIFQNPGTKNRTAIVYKGGQGTGKNQFVDNIGACLGSHYRAVTQQSHVTGKFNSHMKDCLLLFANEAIWGGHKQDSGVLKSLITDPFVQVEQKGVDIYTVKNHVNVNLASNSDFVVPAELDERRFNVIEVNESKKQDRSYFAPLIKQMDSGGREAMLYDLLNIKVDDVDLDIIERNGSLFKQQLKNMDSVTEYWYHRLKDGFILPEKKDSLGNILQESSPIDWDDENNVFPIISQNQFEDYQDYCAARGIKHTENDTVFGNFFSKKFNIEVKRKRINTETLKYRRNFPCLRECQKRFADMMRMSIEDLFPDIDTDD